MIQYEVIPGTSQVYVVFDGSGIGRCKFWLPEGVVTPRGCAGVYPSGMKWLEHDSGLRQGAAGDQVFGPGNVKEVEPGVIECCGVRSVKEAALPWNSSFIFGDTLSICIHVRWPKSPFFLSSGPLPLKKRHRLSACFAENRPRPNGLDPTH